MELKVDEQTMQSLVAKAMFDSMTSEQRDKLVTNAITSLLATPSSQYDKTPAIQRLFNEQVEAAARNIARERLATDESFKASVMRIFGDAAAKCFGDGERRDKIIEALADAMRKAITGDRY